MRGQRREFPGALQRSGNALAALHSQRYDLQRLRDPPIIQDRGGDANRLHQRHAIAHQRPHGPREPRRFRLPQGVAQQRDFQAERIPPHPAGLRSNISVHRDAGYRQSAQNRRAVGLHEFAGAEHDLGGQRHHQVARLEHGGEARDHEVQQHHDRRQTHQQQQGRVNHGRNNVAAQFIARAFEFREAVEHGCERSAGFSGADHVHEEVGEVFRMRRQAVRQRPAALQHAQNIHHDEPEFRTFRKFAGDVDGAVERHAGVQQRGEFLREEQHVAALVAPEGWQL